MPIPPTLTKAHTTETAFDLSNCGRRGRGEIGRGSKNGGPGASRRWWKSGEGGAEINYSRVVQEEVLRARRLTSQI